jgi:glucose repression regulatory protein TUP1
MGSRLAELLDAVKAEFENVTQEASAYKNYKDDYEHKSKASYASMEEMLIAQLHLRYRKCKVCDKMSMNSKWRTKR